MPPIDSTGQTEDFIPNDIATIAVLDLETTNLPAYNFNKVGITELCIFAFQAAELNGNIETSESPAKLPKTPRIMHKLNLLFNPQRMVHPDAEATTGLNNYLLEYQSPLDKNAASTIIGFLKHLQQPICLVAHNGWNFDFPIVKNVFDKLEMTNSLPKGIICVDSLRAFMEIDESMQKTKSQENNLNTVDESELGTKEEIEIVAEILDESAKKSENTEIDWRRLNETTPKRPSSSRNEAAAKRRCLTSENLLVTPTKVATCNEGTHRKNLNSRRSLFTGKSCADIKKYPPKGVYKLGEMYKRIFGEEPTNAHHASADVSMLVNLIQYYGVDFLAFAETQSIPFEKVKKL